MLFLGIMSGEHLQLELSDATRQVCLRNQRDEMWAHTAGSLQYGSTAELSNTARQLARHLDKLRYRTAVRLLGRKRHCPSVVLALPFLPLKQRLCSRCAARGPIEVENVFEVQTWFGSWKKPSRMHGFCRNDGELATRPDLLMLPYDTAFP